MEPDAPIALDGAGPTKVDGERPGGDPLAAVLERLGRIGLGVQQQVGATAVVALAGDVEALAGLGVGDRRLEREQGAALVHHREGTTIAHHEIVRRLELELLDGGRQRLTDELGRRVGLAQPARRMQLGEEGEEHELAIAAIDLMALEEPGEIPTQGGGTLGGEGTTHSHPEPSPKAGELDDRGSPEPGPRLGLRAECRDDTRRGRAQQIVDGVDGTVAHDGARLHERLVAPGRPDTPPA